MKAEDILLSKAMFFELPVHCWITDDILVLFWLIAKFYNEYIHAKIVSHIEVKLILKQKCSHYWRIEKFCLPIWKL